MQVEWFATDNFGLVLRPYNEAVVDELKKVPTDKRTYITKDKKWIVHKSYASEVIRIAKAHKLAGVEKLERELERQKALSGIPTAGADHGTKEEKKLAKIERDGNNNVSIDGDAFVVRWKHNEELLRSFGKLVPFSQWISAEKAWRVPLSAADRLLEFVQLHNFFISIDAVPFLFDLSDADAPDSEDSSQPQSKSHSNSHSQPSSSSSVPNAHKKRKRSASDEEEQHAPQADDDTDGHVKQAKKSSDIKPQQ